MEARIDLWSDHLSFLRKCVQIGRKNPQNRRKTRKTEANAANGRKCKEVVKSRIAGSHRTSSVASSVGEPQGSIKKYCPNRANSIITRMASQLRVVHTKQQRARIATTLFRRIGQFLSNSAQTAHICSVGQKQCDKPHRAKASVQIKVQVGSCPVKP